MCSEFVYNSYIILYKKWCFEWKSAILTLWRASLSKCLSVCIEGFNDNGKGLPCLLCFYSWYKYETVYRYIQDVMHDVQSCIESYLDIKQTFAEFFWSVQYRIWISVPHAKPYCIFCFLLYKSNSHYNFTM